MMDDSGKTKTVFGFVATCPKNLTIVLIGLRESFDFPFRDQVS